MNRLFVHLEVQGLLSPDALRAAVHRQRIHGGSLDTVLLERKTLPVPVLMDALADAWGLPFVPVDLLRPRKDRPWQVVPADLADPGWVLPLEARGDGTAVLVHPEAPPAATRWLAAHAGTAEPYVGFECLVARLQAEREGTVIPQRFAVLSTGILAHMRGSPGATTADPPAVEQGRGATLTFAEPEPSIPTGDGTAPPRGRYAPSTPPAAAPPAASGARGPHAPAEAGGPPVPPPAGTPSPRTASPPKGPRPSEPTGGSTASGSGAGTAPTSAAPGGGDEGRPGTPSSSADAPGDTATRPSGKGGSPGDAPPPFVQPSLARLAVSRDRDDVVAALAFAAEAASDRYALFAVRNDGLVALRTRGLAPTCTEGTAFLPPTTGPVAKLLRKGSQVPERPDDPWIAAAFGLRRNVPCLCTTVRVRGRPVFFLYMDRKGRDIPAPVHRALDEILSAAEKALVRVMVARRTKAAPVPAPPSPPLGTHPKSAGLAMPQLTRTDPPPPHRGPTLHGATPSPEVPKDPRAAARDETRVCTRRDARPRDAGDGAPQGPGFEPRPPASPPGAAPDPGSVPPHAGAETSSARRAETLGPDAPASTSDPAVRAAASPSAPSQRDTASILDVGAQRTVAPPTDVPRFAPPPVPSGRRTTMTADTPPPPVPPPPASAVGSGDGVTDTLTGIPAVDAPAEGTAPHVPPTRSGLAPLSAPLLDAPARPVIAMDEDILPSQDDEAARRADALVDDYLVHEDPRALETLSGSGASGLARLAQRFPGPISVLRRDLARLPAPSAHGPLLRAVVRLGPKITPYLLERLDDANPEVRFYGAFVFQELRDPACMPRLAELVYDANPEVRAIAARVLETYQRAPGYETLCKKIRQGLGAPNRIKKIHAAKAAGTLRDRHAVPALIDLLSSKDRFVQESALEALCSITGQQHGLKPHRWRAWFERHCHMHRIEWIIESLRHRDVLVRRWAHDELVRLTGHRAAPRPSEDRRHQEESYDLWRAWWEEIGRLRPMPGSAGPEDAAAS